jgi:hypothetical protein
VLTSGGLKSLQGPGGAFGAAASLPRKVLDELLHSCPRDSICNEHCAVDTIVCPWFWPRHVACGCIRVASYTTLLQTTRASRVHDTTDTWGKKHICYKPLMIHWHPRVLHDVLQLCARYVCSQTHGNVCNVHGCTEGGRVRALIAQLHASRQVFIVQLQRSATFFYAFPAQVDVTQHGRRREWQQHDSTRMRTLKDILSWLALLPMAENTAANKQRRHRSRRNSCSSRKQLIDPNWS